MEGLGGEVTGIQAVEEPRRHESNIGSGLRRHSTEGSGAGKIPFTTAGADALILRQRDSSCRRDWAAFPSRYPWQSLGERQVSVFGVSKDEIQSWD